MHKEDAAVSELLGVVDEAANAAAQVRPYVAACVQAAPVAFDLGQTLDKLADLAADAARRGARLAVFPEAFVSGYPRGSTSAQRRSHAGRPRTVPPSTSTAPSSSRSRHRGIGPSARDDGLHLVVGVIERDGGTLYCTVLFFGPDGRLLGKHRKLMPTAGAADLGQGDGSTLTVVDTPLGGSGR